MWNASASVPLGLYRPAPIRPRYVGELVAVVPPEPLATFLADGSYLPRGVPMLKHVLALPGQTVCRKGLTIIVDDIAMGGRVSATAGVGRFPSGRAAASSPSRRALPHELAIGRFTGRSVFRTDSVVCRHRAARIPSGSEGD